MLSIQNNPYSIELHESCGLAHEAQVLEVPIASQSPDFFEVVDAATGCRFPLQKSQREAQRGFLLLQVAPFQTLSLHVSASEPVKVAAPVSWTQDGEDAAILSNEKLALRVPLGQREFAEGVAEFAVSGPIQNFRIGNGAWRGRSFFDVREKITRWEGTIEEAGPLRLVYRYRVAIGEGFYEAKITLDAEQQFARVEEEFEAGVSDQIVWDFSHVDLPAQLLLLDSTSGYRTRKLHYHRDTRLARLFCWTQMSQLLDLSDGYALRFAGDTGEADVAGFVTLEGGTWRGNRLNHLEAWERRWLPDQPATRRGVPPEAKADSLPGPDLIPARGNSRCEPHFNLEGWIGSGRRVFALVLAAEKHVQPPRLMQNAADERGCSPSLNHFENRPNRELYRSQQSLLRRIHIQRGMLPLQDLANSAFGWEETQEDKGTAFAYPNAVLEEHWSHIGEQSAEQRRDDLFEYLEARVYGFWEASGAAFTNPVVSRRIAAELFHFEWLERTGQLSPQQLELGRAHFAFLATLFASDNYYPGAATMAPLQDAEATEPTLEGMANQNFYTDIFNLPGVAAQVFPRHPDAAVWRQKFGQMLQRQLEYHVYPQSGVWEESHTYFQHVLLTLLPTLLRRRDDGAHDAFADAALQKLVGGALKQFTPRDAYFDDKRHLLAIGDHSVDVPYRTLYAEYSNAFAPHNAALAAQLAWLHREMGGDKPLAVAPAAPSWNSEWVQGLGYMFRNRDTHGGETLLSLRSGGAWGHHHNDETSIQFFAAGRALIGDAGFGAVLEDEWRKFAAQGHSRWAPGDISPANHLFRFHRGWISDFSSEAPFPYAVAYDPIFAVTTGHQQIFPCKTPIEHWRTVVQIVPGAFLLFDCAETALPQSVHFQVPGQTVQLRETGAWADYDTCRLHICPLWPAELKTPLTRTDRPIKSRKIPDPEHFVTTEIAFQTAAAPTSAFFIAATKPDEAPPQIERRDGAVAISGSALGHQFSVEVSLVAAQLQLTNHFSGATQSIFTQAIKQQS